MSKSEKGQNNKVFLRTIYIDDDGVIIPKDELDSYIIIKKDVIYENKRDEIGAIICQPIRRIEISGKRPVQLTIW